MRMGGSMGVFLREATTTKNMRSNYMLSAKEVQEDEEHKENQQEALRYCVHKIYANLPVSREILSSPGHHLPSILIQIDGADEVRKKYPDACLVDTYGNVVALTTENESVHRHSIPIKDILNAERLDGPKNLRVIPKSSTSLQLDWEPRSSLVHRYEVWKKAFGTDWHYVAERDVLRGNVCEILVEGLEPYTSYQFKVRGKAHDEITAWSQSYEAKTASAPPLAPASILFGWLLPEAVSLFWRQGKERGYPISGYCLEVKDATEKKSEDWRIVYQGKERRYLVTGLEPGTGYIFRVTVKCESMPVSKDSSIESTCQTPTAAAINDGRAPPGNAALLRAGDLWLECFDGSRVFYFNRISCLTEYTPPPEFVSLHTNSSRADPDHRHLPFISIADPVTRFRLKRYRFMKEIKSIKRRHSVTTVSHADHTKICIDRNHLLRDSLSALRMLPIPELRHKFNIEYINEAGIDSGGLTKDWYLQLSRALSHNDAGFFLQSEECKDLELQPHSFRTLDDFRILGRFIAKAIYDQQCIDLPLSLGLYATLRGRVGGTVTTLTEEDSGEGEVAAIELDTIVSEAPSLKILHAILFELKAIDPSLHNSLRWMLDNDIGDDGSVLSATFSVPKENDESTQIELIENGQTIDVTNKNKVLYAFLKARYRCRSRVAMESDALLDGLADMGLTVDAIATFSNYQLHTLLNGRIVIDVDEIRALTHYQNFEATHIVALWFWQFLHQLQDTDIRLVLKFATGTTKLPLDGFSPAFTLTLDNEKSNALPTAHTCFNQLVLPLYSDFSIMCKQILLAVQNSDSFEMG